MRVLVCGMSTIVGACLFAMGCDEVLKPWCTENRRQNWQAVAVDAWDARRDPWPCDPVNAWACLEGDGAVADMMVVRFRAVDDVSRVCNMTVPVGVAQRAMARPNTSLTLWPKFPPKGCRLEFTRRDVLLARVGFALLWAPVVGALFVVQQCQCRCSRARP